MSVIFVCIYLSRLPRQLIGVCLSECIILCAIIDSTLYSSGPECACDVLEHLFVPVNLYCFFK